MDSNLIVLTDQDGNSVRFELLDIVEYKEDEYAAVSYTHLRAHET